MNTFVTLDISIFSCTVSNKDRPPSPPKQEKAPAAAGSKGKQAKGAKDKGAKDKGGDGKSSRPSSQQFDITKPNWTLRVVSDAVAAVSLKLLNIKHELYNVA